MWARKDVLRREGGLGKEMGPRRRCVLERLGIRYKINASSTP
jgi:hypothetical protein